MLEDIDEVMETMQIEEEPLIDDQIQLIETFAESESATDFQRLLRSTQHCPRHRRSIGLL